MMPSMAGNLAGVIISDDISARYIKAKEYEVILRTRCSLWCQHCSLVMLLYSEIILSLYTLGDTFESEAMIIRLMSNGFHHFPSQQI